jgi:multisubunit Na+/H+ antiporter MnhG subunit
VRAIPLLRKILGALFAILGTYYCVHSAATLVRLPRVTTRWVQASGDPDFKYDYGLFLMLIAIGAVAVATFGLRSAVKGVAAARGQRQSWLALALGAPILHTFWLLFRIIGTGELGRAAQATAIRYDEIRFTSTCLAYVAMWILMRERKTRRSSAPDLSPELTTN